MAELMAVAVYMAELMVVAVYMAELMVWLCTWQS
jgi:hypothetical protein